MNETISGGATPRVTAVMPIYNGERFLAAAVDSVLNQTFTDWELLIVNDGSTDGSEAMALDHARTDSRIRCVTQPNGGLVAARNTGIREARGNIVAFLDCDDVWRPEHLARSVAVMDAEPDVIMAHADIAFMDEAGHITIPAKGGRWRGWEDRPFEALLLRHEHVSMPTVCVRRDACIEAGMFDMRYNRLGCEDRNMWLRLMQMGKVRYIDQYGADYRMVAGSMSKQIDKMMVARRQLVEDAQAFPEGRRLRNAALAALALSEAEEGAVRSDFTRLVGCYLRAIRHQPADKRAWRGLAGTVLQRTGLRKR